jgi:hypothetical protein
VRERGLTKGFGFKGEETKELVVGMRGNKCDCSTTGVGLGGSVYWSDWERPAIGSGLKERGSATEKNE